MLPALAPIILTAQIGRQPIKANSVTCFTAFLTPAPNEYYTLGVLN